MAKPSNTVRLRQFHAIAAVVWAVALIPTLLIWRESVLWVAFMSLWANVVGHWSAWQAARAETAAEAS